MISISFGHRIYLESDGWALDGASAEAIFTKFLIKALLRFTMDRKDIKGVLEVLGSSSSFSASPGNESSELSFVGAVSAFALGMIGEYLARIFEEVKARPEFVIKERLGGE